jgi:hypothetical protein
MGVSTRPSKKHRQRRKFNICALAMVLSLASANPSMAAPTPDVDDAPTTQSIAPTTPHDVAISVVEPGQESLSLTARLTPDSTTMARDVTWQVRSDAGELMFNQTNFEVSAPLAPGQYIVEAQYGAVSLRETVRLTPGNAVAVNFVLNAGGLRVLPALKDLTLPDTKTKTLVFALAGPDRGKLVAHTDQAGEILKLPAGQYRVESRIGDGNTTAVTDVRVRPGKLSAIEVQHQAGIARLSYVGSPDAAVKWDVRPIDGAKILSIDGITQKLTLKPGTYLAEAHVNGEILTAKFKIIAGEERDIMLGN